MTQINLRIEEKTKKAASKTLAGLGLDMSSAITIFLNQVIVENGLPFVPTRNPKVLRAKWDADVSRALKNGRVYTSARRVLEDL